MGDINTTEAFTSGQQTVSSTALLLTAFTAFDQDDVDATARIIVSVRSNQVNVLWDGTAPTVAIGITYQSGDVFEVAGNINIRKLQFIRNGASDSVIDVILEE